MPAGDEDVWFGLVWVGLDIRLGFGVRTVHGVEIREALRRFGIPDLPLCTHLTLGCLRPVLDRAGKMGFWVGPSSARIGF